MNPKTPLERIAIVASKSRYDLSIKRWGSEEYAKKGFRSTRKWEEITESNRRQKNNITKVINELGSNSVIDRSALTPETINYCNLLVFLGGDDHFTYCSQVLLQYMKERPGEKKYVAGVILDPIKSWGGLLYFNVDSFLGNLHRLTTGKYQVEHWTTLEAKVHNGVKEMEPYPAAAHFFAGEYCNLFMSRSYVFEQEAYIDGKEILPEKSSGIIVAVGAGSGDGSWYDNIHQGYFDVADELEKDAEIARVIARENKVKAKTTLYKGQKLILDSYNDARGILSPDSHEEHSVPFDMGSQVEIWISDLKLAVVRIN